MTVREIVPLDKRRSKVIFEEGFTLALYRGELSKYNILEGGELLEGVYEEILHEILFKRARERAVYILKASDKTEQELRRKLKDGYYPEEAIDYTILFLKEYHYIDDENYGRRYAAFQAAKKSRRQIQYELQQKGLEKETVADILNEQPVDEEEQVRTYLRKKRLVPGELGQKDRNKVLAALGRKGFSYEVVNRVMGRVYEEY